jgi:hypothetical protein
MTKAKDSVKFGNLALSIGCKEAAVLKDAEGNVIARILINERHGEDAIIRILIQAPKDIGIVREPVTRKTRVPGVAGTRSVEKTRLA